MATDLAKSGLVPQDVFARVIEGTERAATSTPYSVGGYVIPYYNIEGKYASFYRVRLFDHDAKYKQPKETSNHVYFPKNFMGVLNASKKPYILITEGEKKAALACKVGIPAVAFGGVDSWRNRTIVLPVGVELTEQSKRIRAKLPSGSEYSEDFTSTLALGMQDLIDYALRHNKHLVIVYDTESKHGTSVSVQRAAASLGYELRFRGVPYEHIRQMLLPILPDVDRTALDDFIMKAGAERTINLLDECVASRSAFPRHPNVQDYLNKRLQKTKMSRKETQATSIAVISELDAGGIRLRSMEEMQSYYFDLKTHKLMRTGFAAQPDEMTEDIFGQYMYKKFGVGAADHRLMRWIGTQFTGEDPIQEVQPFRVIARPSDPKFRDSVVMQLSDGQYAVINAQGMEIFDNGINGILFESGRCEPLNTELLKQEWEKQSKEVSDNSALNSWWMNVLNDVRLKDKTKTRMLVALLYYISPFLYRWRGTQLPIEMVLGEAGSGKSTLAELRLLIQTGKARLRNAPQDLKDWNASITNSGGLHVTDNVHFAEKNLKQKLSDELCRLVTESNPSIELRKYFTTADQINIPVHCVFSFTAINQPFMNSDVIQRSIIIELDKAQDIMDDTLTYDSVWKDQQLSKHGGREAWLAHHFIALQRFFQIVERKWRVNYRAKHRLINLEQSLMLMAEVFSLPNAWIPDFLVKATDRAITDADYAFEGLRMFSQYWMNVIEKGNGKTDPKFFTVQEIGNWASGDPEYEGCEILVNTRKLGRYLKQHKSQMITSLGLIESGTQNNRQRFKFVQK